VQLVKSENSSGLVSAGTNALSFNVNTGAANWNQQPSAWA
jgi:hypothetical protein